MRFARYPGKPYIAPSRPVQIPRSRECKELVLGPLQINWYGAGWRIYLTWPKQYVVSSR